MARNEGEAALRDAVLLTAAGNDPGPAGKVFLAFKRVATRKPAFSSKAEAELADLLGLAWDGRLAAAVDHAEPHRLLRRAWSRPCMRCGRMPSRSPGCWPTC